MTGYDSIGTFILTGIGIIISITIHEYSHALVSTKLGDKTPEMYGRLTLNPLAHIDLLGLISLFIFRFGWAKPVPIDSSYYKDRRKGIILTSLAGPVSNLILAFFSLLILRAAKPQSRGLDIFLIILAQLNTGLAVFNMIPLSPLDGSKIFAELFGGRVADIIYSLERYGTFLIFILIWIPAVQNAISFMTQGVLRGLYALAGIFA